VANAALLPITVAAKNKNKKGGCDHNGLHAKEERCPFAKAQEWRGN